MSLLTTSPFLSRLSISADDTQGTLPSEGELSVTRRGVRTSSCLTHSNKTDALNTFHAALQGIEPDPGWYSNPSNMGFLPFPLLYPQLPTEPFSLTQENTRQFKYMGRDQFRILWDSVRSLEIHTGLSRVYLQGTMGYGKSHILAALACLLFRLGYRPVYIDCRKMLADPLRYIRFALLGAFADPSSSSQRASIRSLGSETEVVKFCNNQSEPMYFILDQKNALDLEDANGDDIYDKWKEPLSYFLVRMTVGHYRITSASANHKTAVHMGRKQTGELKMSMMGGMSEGSNL